MRSPRIREVRVHDAQLVPLADCARRDRAFEGVDTFNHCARADQRKAAAFLRFQRYRRGHVAGAPGLDRSRLSTDAGPRSNKDATDDDYDLVTTATALQGVVDELLDEPRYAVDTEFHRERTYFPKVALVQLAWPGRTVLVDPMAVSLEPLSKVLQGSGLAVLHASNQDLEVLDLACGTTPSRLFDTAVAAGFWDTHLIARVVVRRAPLRLPKASIDRWLVRPLTATWPTPRPTSIICSTSTTGPSNGS